MVEPQIVPAPGVAPSTPPAPKQSHVFRTLAIIFIVLLLLGGAAAAYYYSTVLAATPENVMARMFTAMKDVSSASADVTLEGSGNGIPKSAIYIPTDVTYTTAVDSTLALHASVRVDDTAKNFDGTMTFTTTTDGEDVTSIRADVRSIADVDYVQLTNLATPLVPTELAHGMDLVTNRWIVIDKNEIAKSLHLDELLTQVQEAEAANSAVTEAVNLAIAQNLPSVIVITNTLASEEIDGVGTYHYAYSVDKNAAGVLLDGIESAMGTDAQFSSVRSFLGESDDITGEVWIGKKDALVRKVTATTSTKGSPRFTLHASLLLSDFGGVYDIVAPEGATPIKDVLMEVIMKVSADATADDDGDGLQNSDEDTYGTDRANPDTDGDGYTDGAEVEGGYNPNGEGKL